MMTEQQKADLTLLYQGEVFGEMFYCTLLQHFRSPKQQHLLGSLLQLETESKARVRPFAFEHDISLIESEYKRKEGAEFVRHVKDMEWIDAAASLVPISEDAVADYRRIANEAPEEWKPLAEAMVKHEFLILDATKLAAEGEDEKAADLVSSHLVYPLPQPPSAPMNSR